MNFLSPYFTEIKRFTDTESSQFSVSAQQGNDFAKKVADDFNPIHHTDSKRFCVPGDLLFAIALNQYGLYENMAFQFLDLVKAGTPLHYPSQQSKNGAVKLLVVNDRDKPVLGIEAQGGRSQDSRQIEQLIKKYVAFSGHNFPHILVPLMKEHDVMINPKRPLVIYESMALVLDHLNFETLDINLEQTTLRVEGKRGTAKLHFSLTDTGANNSGVKVGSGVKTLVLSGLRAYEEAAINEMCEEYLSSKPI